MSPVILPMDLPNRYHALANAATLSLSRQIIMAAFAQGNYDAVLTQQRNTSATLQA